MNRKSGNAGRKGEVPDSKGGAASGEGDIADRKRELERRIARTRGSITETVSDLKENIRSQVRGVKRTASDVMDYRKQFAQEPVIWSLSALAAGFALGYKVGAARRSTRGRARPGSFSSAFTDALLEVSPHLDANLHQLLGIDLGGLLENLRQGSMDHASRSPVRSRVSGNARPRKSRSRARLNLKERRP